ncbi:MAG: DnaA/Hda family protein [Alphaproteobacteria bacterium]|nr:DnaA/Hda family protein [Alphaproteobacteria bacterium]
MTTPLRQLPLDLKFAPAMGRDDFMVGACNQYAVHMVEHWPAEWSPYPALTIYGPKGSGKSHLAAVWQNLSKGRILTLEEFIACDIENLIESKENLVLEGVEFLIGDRVQEEKLFHLYNAFQQNGIYFLALSTISPEKMVFEIRDLESRLRAAQSAEIKPPDDDLLTKVMAKRFFDQNLKIDQESLDYILWRMERSWSGLDHLVEKICLTATALQKGELTKPLLRAAMIDME